MLHNYINIGDAWVRAQRRTYACGYTGHFPPTSNRSISIAGSEIYYSLTDDEVTCGQVADFYDTSFAAAR